MEIKFKNKNPFNTQLCRFSFSSQKKVLEVDVNEQRTTNNKP
jgi:hypothetical protein